MKLLEASNGIRSGCIFCGYNGEGYYQKHTHAEECPWYEIGGGKEREDALPRVIQQLQQEKADLLQKAREMKEILIKENSLVQSMDDEFNAHIRKGYACAISDFAIEFEKAFPELKENK